MLVAIFYRISFHASSLLKRSTKRVSSCAVYKLRERRLRLVLYTYGRIRKRRHIPLRSTIAGVLYCWSYLQAQETFVQSFFVLFFVCLFVCVFVCFCICAFVIVVFCFVQHVPNSVYATRIYVVLENE